MFAYEVHLSQIYKREEFRQKSYVSKASTGVVCGFGAKGYKVEKTEDLIPTLKQAIIDNTVVIVDCPVDYGENMKLTEKLGNLVSPI